MIRKLRIKFVAAAMLSLLVVLAVILGAVILSMYAGILRDADEVLDLLQKNDGRFPVEMRDGGRPPFPGEGDPEAAPPDGGDPGAAAGIRGQAHLADSPELAYETRFFSAVVAEDGTVSATDTEFIAAVDGEEAEEMAAEVFSRGRERGFAGDYRFSEEPCEGGVRVIFLDCSRNLATFRSTIGASAAVAGAGLAAVFLLTALASGRITRPIAESYAKQKRFITDAGHELKTPLAIINADADVLETEMPDSEWLRDIRVQTGRLADLTNDLI
ncbi:MAG: two-component sensor histidine kinase, partial [Oscillospiraceae bacterium]|nr:two-component sensor histidine kinase [Oscillospiraceae bacterium]